jgi:Family of unknown function (DUF5996)
VVAESSARGLPELRIADWRTTKETLHLYAQIVGKVRLATTPPRNHWWHAPLYVDVRGLTTGSLHRGDTTFEIAFDLVDHELVVRTIGGNTRAFPLRDGLSVADPRLVELGARGVQRLVRRQDEPHPALLAQPRPFADALLRPVGFANSSAALLARWAR